MSMNHRRRLLTIATTLALALAGGTALAAEKSSACKGLEKMACGSKSSCTWVDSYTRKDGKKVNAYCRTVTKKKKPS